MTFFIRHLPDGTITGTGSVPARKVASQARPGEAVAQVDFDPRGMDATHKYVDGDFVELPPPETSAEPAD